MPNTYTLAENLPPGLKLEHIATLEQTKLEQSQRELARQRTSGIPITAKQAAKQVVSAKLAVSGYAPHQSAIDAFAQALRLHPDITQVVQVFSESEQIPVSERTDEEGAQTDPRWLHFTLHLVSNTAAVSATIAANRQDIANRQEGR